MLRHVSKYNDNLYIDFCDMCGEELAAWLCDSDGVPVKKLYDRTDEHVCLCDDDWIDDWDEEYINGLREDYYDKDDTHAWHYVAC